MGVSRKDLGDRFFEVSGLLDPQLDRIDPIGGNLLDTFLAVEHEGERPDGVTLTVDAMAGGLATSEMRERQGSREAIRGKLRTIQKSLDAAAEAGGLRALGRNGLSVHTRCNNTSRYV